MIRSIQRIKDFGVFADFHWPATLPDFKQFNLIYGWNYSGKTTLSRVFRCFEQQSHHVDFPGAHAHLMDHNGNAHHLSSPKAAPVFRVFNSDFVRDNLSFEEGNATAVLVLGAEDIAKREALKLKKTEQFEVATRLEAEKAKKARLEQACETKLTKTARDLIKNALGVPNYDKTRFLPKVTECIDSPETFLLDDPSLDRHLSVFRSTDKKPALTKKTPTFSPFTTLVTDASTLLAKVVTANKPIMRLKNNATLELWVKNGRALHEKEADCQFCGQSLPDDLMTELAGHFSADYEDLMSKLKILIAEIESALKEDCVVDDKAAFYNELSSSITKETKSLEKAIAARKAALLELQNSVIEKQTNAFTVMKCPALEDNASEIESAVKAINGIIEEHNVRTEEFEKNRKHSFSSLEMHYAATFVRDEDYKGHRAEIKSLEQSIDVDGRNNEKLKQEIAALEVSLSETKKGASRINELLEAYFGKDDLKIAEGPDKQFQILRKLVVAKNLSEGEKTAIAFAHFITRTQDGQHPIEDTIVVVDDPISSLDANHLFNTYAMIKTQLTGCRQLFLSTHSFEFYNLIREWVSDDEKDLKKPQHSWKKWGVFLVKRTDNGNSVVTEIPGELLRFKSEYHYLFSVLFHFDKSGANAFDCLLTLPNVVRRFLEAFGGIMIPLSIGLKGKMPRLFPEEVERERVWKFVNHYSHNTTITRSLIIPDTSECEAVVKSCLNAIRDWDAEYFKDLESEVS